MSIQGAQTVVCLCLMTTLVLNVSHGQTAGIPTPIAPMNELSQEREPSEESAIAELAAKRAKAETESKALTIPAASSAPQGGLLEQQALLEQVVRGYDEQIEDHQRLKEAGKRRADTARASVEWKGFVESPPYSIFFVDQLWETAFSLRLAVEGLQSQLSLIELRFDRARESLSSAESRVRQASEQLEAVTDPSRAARHRDQRDLEELRRRAAAVTVAATEMAKRRVEEELAETQARLTFAERQLEAAEQQVSFGEEDIEKVRKRLSQERHALEGELERTIVEHRAQSQALQTSVQHEAQLSKQFPAVSLTRNVAAMTRATMAVELKRAQQDNLMVRGDLLRQLLDVVEGERQLWESRFAVARDPDPRRARESYARLAPLFANFRAFRDHLRQQLVATSGRIIELDNRLEQASRVDDRRQLTSLLHINRQREMVYNRSLQRTDEASRLLERWKSEFKEQRRELPLAARIDDWRQQAWEGVKRGWTSEVFSVEDTIEVEGKKITGQRSVTLGKIVSALAILVVGYWLCLCLARLIGRLAVVRLGMSAGVANLLRQWSQAVLLTLLVVISLVSVKIPLTVFAFLGGAFAIGVGFGAQNLLKNLISGILVLIERPLRVGDLIEVNNVRGRVTTIGLRSSTVLDAKGLETLIPNSSFLEQHLTNWTYSNSHSRFSLRIGAPYGSSVRDVLELLAKAAGDHPQILKAPPPQILLEEFGGQARIFSLNYWLEMRLDVDPNEVASDLRFAIEESFTKAGLKVHPAA
ncbi:MAG: mechanosensitive ion channel domain-containing protein [Nitrospira sp.]